MHPYNRRKLVTALAVALPFVVGTVASRETEAAVADTTVNYYVKEALRDDGRTSASAITVSTKEGIVRVGEEPGCQELRC